jgi:hypothetical protein
MSRGQIIQLAALALGLFGTWMVAFGLRIKAGIDPSFRKDLSLDPKLIVPADVSQRPWLFKGGLGILTFGAALQAVYLICF